MRRWAWLLAAGALVAAAAYGVLEAQRERRLPVQCGLAHEISRGVMNTPQGQRPMLWVYFHEIRQADSLEFTAPNPPDWIVCQSVPDSVSQSSRRGDS